MGNKKKISMLAITILVATVAVVGINLTKPAYALTMDVNPSIEIVSNKLNRVVEVNPLNEDAKELLKDFDLKDRNLHKTVEDLADLMVLKGYISGGKDNVVMITVDDNSANKNAVSSLNKVIAAYLENKQIEATILNQIITKEYGDKTGKEIVAEKISDKDDVLDYENLLDMSLRELITLAEERGIAPQALLSNILKIEGESKDKAKANNQIIGEAKAKEIALNLVNGKIVKFKFDNDDDDPEYEIKIITNGHKYEIKIDAYTGKVIEFEKDDDSDIEKKVIGEAKAKEIALGLVNGEIVKFKFDDDDDDPEYEIKIIADGHKYEIEIDAYTGKVLEFEKDDDYNDNKNNKDNNKSKSIKKKVISEVRAKEIALGLVNGKIVNFEFDNDDDDPEYKLEIIANGYEYEIEIDAYSGKVLEFEKDDYDKDDKDDKDD
ncbi:MAG: PepSY domain-containing protein [Tissierellia bacterium]|nr:PepSY domain-containing protein [Tissierellia bacterium]MDD4725515.1 PepSY domain-containing protein [Tissierellia bacterium]